VERETPAVYVCVCLSVCVCACVNITSVHSAPSGALQILRGVDMHAHTTGLAAFGVGFLLKFNSDNMFAWMAA